MNWFTGVVLYVLIWWTTLFAVLPFGTKPVSEADPTSGWRGAPERPRLLMKIIATTIVAAIIWGACVAVIESPYVSFRAGWWAMPDDEAH